MLDRAGHKLETISLFQGRSLVLSLFVPLCDWSQERALRVKRKALMASAARRPPVAPLVLVGLGSFCGGALTLWSSDPHRQSKPWLIGSENILYNFA